MPDRILIANWKMNLDFQNSEKLITEVVNQYSKLKSNNYRKIIICPPSIFIENIFQKTLAYPQFEVGSQNLYPGKEGAFTGEISAYMLKSIGCSYTIIGHSERRSYFGETDQTIALKIKAALSENILPILCVGETLSERENSYFRKIIERQLVEGLAHVSEREKQLKKIVIAYEPVWAIGTGKTANPELASEVHSFIREILKKLFGNDISSAISILYGGSVKSSNASELFMQPDINGALVGGASLDAHEFMNIYDKL